MRAQWEPEDLISAWTLVDRDWELVGDKRRTGRLGPWDGDPVLQEVYARALATVPAVQAKALHVMFDAQRRIAGALVRAFPGRLDAVSAAAATGALMGAVQAAGMASLEAYGDDVREHSASTGRAVDIALRGVESL
jgi:hypothetical protein